MKKFGIGLIVAGVILFLIGVFDIFNLCSYRWKYFIWFGVPVVLFGIGVTTYALFQETKIETQRNLQKRNEK